jgi:hypothetical protein
LRSATVYFSSQKKEQEFDKIAAEYGVSTEVTAVFSWMKYKN